MPLGFKALGFEAPDPSVTATEASSSSHPPPPSSPLPGLPSDSRHAGQFTSRFTDAQKGGSVMAHAMAPDEDDLDIEGRPPYIHVRFPRHGWSQVFPSKREWESLVMVRQHGS